MICFCPYCGKPLQKPLNNGVSFCEKCSRTIVSTKENELLSSYRILTSKVFNNENQLKSALKIDPDDFEFIKSCADEGLSMDEFTKYLKSKIA
jgi:uncharacterized Zn finger protein (UPF0148 family)